jgi:hypothetical protein
MCHKVHHPLNYSLLKRGTWSRFGGSRYLLLHHDALLHPTHNTNLLDHSDPTAGQFLLEKFLLGFLAAVLRARTIAQKGLGRPFCERPIFSSEG